MGAKKVKRSIYIVTTIAGVFAVSEDDKIKGYVPFPKDPRKVADKIKTAEQTIIKEEKELMEKFKGSDFIFPEKKEGIKQWDKSKEEFVRQNLRKLAVEKGIVKDQSEFNQFLTKVNIALTKAEIKKTVKRDSLVVQVNGAIDELDKAINILTERLREFFSLHFPEMDRIIPNHERYAKIVEEFGSREKIDDPELKRFVKNSMGIDLKKEDVNALQKFASQILELYKLRKSLEDYLDNLLKEVAPNFRALAGSKIAGKLIAQAGGLDRLAKMPSSTIQLLGAEKALFRHLHGRGKSPKHGVISSHPLLQNAPKDMKGKVARLIASKLSIAAKLDNFSKKDQSSKLKSELEKKIKETIKKK
jgi:nucleolar protein 56